MEFIKVEEFLGQPAEVQKVLLAWWKPSIGDLVLFEYMFDDVNEKGEECDGFYNKIKVLNDEDIQECNLGIIKDITVCPLLVEGQLRQFIEDKTKNKIKVEPNYYEECYMVNVDTGTHGFNGLSESLLYAYWNIAIELAVGVLKIMSKYNIGDKVIIKDNLIPWCKYDEILFITDMKPFIGKETFITKIYEDGCYNIDIDGELYFWTDSMFK